VGCSAPWRSELIMSPCVWVQNGTYMSGMVLNINSYALHGLIIHRDHRNVNHISSSIILNMCIKSLIPQLKSQRHYTNLQYKFLENHRASYWASVHWKFLEETSFEPCKWVMWERDFQASGYSESRGCKALPVGAFV
jgi:hypothetical protein